MFPERLCFKRWQTVGLSRIYLPFFLYFLTRIAVTQLTLKDCWVVTLELGKFVEMWNKVRREIKRKSPKSCCLADCFMTMGVLPGTFMCESRTIFLKKTVDSCDFWSLSGLQVVVSVSQLGNSAKVSGTSSVCIMVGSGSCGGAWEIPGLWGRKEMMKAWLYIWNVPLNKSLSSNYNLSHFPTYR